MTNMPSRSLRQPPPMSPSMVRDALMERAGLSPAIQARILKRAVNTALRGLKAQKVQVISHMGQVTDKVEVPDNMAQLRASELLTTILGAAPSKDSNASVSVKVEINLPDWARPEVIDTVGVQVCDAETPT